MTDNFDLTDVPHATTVPKKRMRFSVVWIIPIVAALVGLGIAIQQILRQGPTINIVFKTAEGIEARKTFIKYKDVNIGHVTKKQLSKDFLKVVVTAKIDKSAEGLIVEDTKFWVEQPRVTLSRISGIGTLLSGNYIGIELGTSSIKSTEFIGLETPPSITLDHPGRQFVLQAGNRGSVMIGSPLYYRSLNVGQVTGYDLAADGRSVAINVFVDAPYDKYVMPQTRFWQASGIDATLGANGISVQTQSVLSMLIGGIAFETPPTAQHEKPAEANSVFALYSDRSAATAQHEAIVTSYVLYFTESLRGLSVGAPVTYLGLPVGEVTGVGLEYDQATTRVKARVDIVVYPGRFLKQVKKSAAAEEMAKSERWRHGFMQRMVEQGIRAQLRSGSIVTGQLYIAFDRFPNAPKVKIDWTKEPPELPVMLGSLQDLENKINSILTKIEKMPLEAIGEDVKKLLASLDQTLKSIDGEVLPELKTTLEDLRRTIGAAESVLKNTDATLVGKDSPAQQELRDALQEIARAARAISVFTEYLERNPSSLIRGKTQEKP
jgi:paraquat-inducible protein B